MHLCCSSGLAFVYFAYGYCTVVQYIVVQQYLELGGGRATVAVLLFRFSLDPR
jgi:hypothetical protein